MGVRRLRKYCVLRIGVKSRKHEIVSSHSTWEAADEAAERKMRTRKHRGETRFVLYESVITAQVNQYLQLIDWKGLKAHVRTLPKI